MAHRPGVSDILKMLRTGQPAGWPGENDAADWHASMRTPAFAEAFTAAMHCRGRVLAPALAAAVDCSTARRLLDVGGGSGGYSLALLDDDKARPLWAAEYSVLLATVTQIRLYSAAEIAGWLTDLDFEIIARPATALGRSVLTAARYRR